MARFLDKDLSVYETDTWIVAPKHITITLYVNNNDNHNVTNDYDNVDDLIIMIIIYDMALYSRKNNVSLLIQLLTKLALWVLRTFNEHDSI